jgi:hypothetical protein
MVLRSSVAKGTYMDDQPFDESRLEPESREWHRMTGCLWASDARGSGGPSAGVRLGQLASPGRMITTHRKCRSTKSSQTNRNVRARPCNRENCNEKVQGDALVTLTKAVCLI